MTASPLSAPVGDADARMKAMMDAVFEGLRPYCSSSPFSEDYITNIAGFNFR